MQTEMMSAVWATHARAVRDEEGPKPTAHGTAMRVSDAGACLRQRALTALGIPELSTIDTSTLLAFSLGTAIHDQLQAALLRAYPDARIEEAMDLRPLGVDLSGHCDGIITENGVTTVLEFKSVGGYAAKIAWGADLPKREHVAQAALYAKACDAAFVHLVYVAKEKAFATKKTPAISPGDMREWTFDMDEPIVGFVASPAELAQEESDRVKMISKALEDGVLPANLIPGDDGVLKLELFPGPYMEASKTSSWQCRYCRHNSTCVSLGSAAQPVPVDLIPEKEEA